MVFYRKFDVTAGVLLLRLARVESDIMVLSGWLNHKAIDSVQAERYLNANHLGAAL